MRTRGRCQMFKMSTYGHNSYPRPKSPPINRLINDRLSVNQMLPQLINISHRMLTDTLLQHSQDCVTERTDIGCLKKSQVGYYDQLQHPTTKQLDGCAHTLCWRAAMSYGIRQETRSFLPCDCEAYARYCCRDSVCLSVRLSVKRVYCDKTKAPSHNKVKVYQELCLQKLSSRWPLFTIFGPRNGLGVMY